MRSRVPPSGSKRVQSAVYIGLNLENLKDSPYDFVFAHRHHTVSLFVPARTFDRPLVRRI